jgi:peptide chain release factor 1
VGFKVSVANANETELGGYKEISFTVEGDGAYSRFKFESGVHRVQRVPETESQGRIQTSTATVAVLPEVEDVEIEIKESDLVFESCKSSGAGGQHINKTESAVRLTHKPTGIVIECQQERSQFQNKDKALEMLRAKLYHIKKTEQDEARASARKSQVGSGDRSEKIRTYNYPQSRVTDHRIGFSIYDLDGFMNGGIAPMIEALTAADTAEKLKDQEEHAQ